MSKRDPSQLIQDTLEAIERIRSYVVGMDFEQFGRDSKTTDAVVRNLQVLGEAANRIPPTVRAVSPDIEWERIIRSRHIVTHDYFGIDYEIVWRIT